MLDVWLTVQSFGDPDEPIDEAFDGPASEPNNSQPAGNTVPPAIVPEPTAGDDSTIANAQDAIGTSGGASGDLDAVQEDMVEAATTVQPIVAQEAESATETVFDAAASEDRPSGEAGEAQASGGATVEHPPPLHPDYSVVRLIEKAEHSAGKLVNLLAKHFPCFRDETRFDGKRVRLFKRAQIFVADLWAALGGTGYGEFHDIDHLTMFAGKPSSLRHRRRDIRFAWLLTSLADYRVPQMLHSLGVLSYSPPLDHRIRSLQPIPSGHSWEVQLRGCSIWAVELIRREILRNHPDARLDAVLIDFFLYDLAKERERIHGGLAMPHHRTRSIWY